MAGTYSAGERRALVEALARGDEPVRCPVCGAGIARHDADPGKAVPYVRQRAWLICTGCKRSAAVDLRAGGRP